MERRRAQLISRIPGRPRSKQGGFLGNLFKGLRNILFGKPPKPPPLPTPPPTPAPLGPDRRAAKEDALMRQRDQQADAHRSRIRRGRRGSFAESPFSNLGG